jgi:hypothetical protein
MSFDPYGYQESSRPPSGEPSGTPIPQGASEAAVPPDLAATQRLARERVTLPAMFLIVVGVLNLLPAAYFAVNTLYVTSLTPEQLQKQMVKQNPAMQRQLDDLAEQGYTVADIKRLGEYVCGGLSGGGFLVSLITIVGGIRMLQLKNYGLAVFASLVAAVPCLSGVACCGVGEIVAVWSIWVLLQVDVRSAFR